MRDPYADPLERLMPTGNRFSDDERDYIVKGALMAIANGKSVRSYCENEPLAPHLSTLFIWFTKFPEYRVAYIASRMLAAEVMIDHVLDLADDKGADPKRSKLQIDTRLKLAGYYSPEKYGDKIDITSAGRAIGDIPAGASPEERIEHILRRVRGQLVPPAPAIIDGRAEKRSEEAAWSVFDD